MRKILLVLLLALTALPASSSAFNGERKGFVLGGGLGLAPMARWSVDVFGDSYDESKVGFGVQLVIGYAWDEFNMIVYEGNVTGFSQDFGSYGSQSIAQGFNGASWYHYFGPKGCTFFTTAGLGFYYFDVEDFDTNDAGIGYLLGGGYEFTPHVQAGIYLSGGKTSDPLLDYGHNNFSLLVSAVAF